MAILPYAFDYDIISKEDYTMKKIMRISTPTSYNSGYTPLKLRMATKRYMPF